MKKRHCINIPLLFSSLFLALTTSLQSQNVGIGTSTPDAKLEISHILQDSFLISEDFEAAGNLPLPFTTGGDELWEVDAVSGSIGLASARSGNIEDSQVSYMELQVLIPDRRTAVLKFKAKTESEAIGDYLIFELDGAEAFTLSGDYGWFDRSFLLSEGTHNLKWSYIKNGEVDYLDDFAAVDSIRINYVEKFALRIDDGKQARGKLLVSDEYGNATWEKLSNSSIDDTDEDTGVYAEYYNNDNDAIHFKVNNSFPFVIRKSGPSSNLVVPGQNIVIGAYSLPTHSGIHNTFLGSYSGSYNGSGFNNTYLGYSAGRYNETGDDNLFLGAFSGWVTVESKNVFVGSYSGLSNTIGTKNVFVGYGSARDNIDGSKNTFLGSYSGENNLTGNNNVMLGYDAGKANISGSENTFVGYEAGNKVDTTSGLTFVGYRSGANNISGMFNTFTGYRAGQSSNSGDANAFYGSYSGWTNTSGSNNSFFGFSAGFNNSLGDENTFVGHSAGFYNTQGIKNTFVGNNAGESNSMGDENTFIGHRASENNTTGSYNTSIGYNINQGVNSSYNTHVGYESVNISGNSYYNASAFGYSAVVDGSNRIKIGNASVAVIGGYSGWSDLSDERMKKGIAESNVPGLEFIRQLRPVSYTIDYPLLAEHLGEDKKERDGQWVEEPADPFFIRSREERSRIRQTGFIAQEVEALIKESGVDFNAVNVPSSGDGLYSLKYAEFVVPLVKAVQELSEENDSLRKTLDEQRAMLIQLSERVDLLERL